jgi:endoglucanase
MGSVAPVLFPVRADRRHELIRTRRSLATRLLGLGGAVALAATAAVAVSVAGAGPAYAAGTGTGFLSASGAHLVDSTGATVRLTGINWFGMETDNKTFHGLWANVTWRSMIDHMAQLGYNTIRVPYSDDALKPGAQATSVNTFTNPDLVGQSPLQILDKVIDYAGSKGMRIFLDRHRPTSAMQTALWYNAATPESTWISNMQMLATRYRNNPTVVGIDLHNEPHADGGEPNSIGACWGCGDTARDWRLAAERGGNAVLQSNPDWLIIVEGVSCVSGGIPNPNDSVPDPFCGWWGGNLSAAQQFPVRLSRANKLVYSAHEYGISVFHQNWFDDPAFPNNLPAIWNAAWGYLVQQNIAPVLVGEFGSTLADPKDAVWLQRLMQYMGTGTAGMNFTYWAWNPNSGDTGGIVQDDWVTVNQNKQSILQPYLIAPVATGTPPGGGTTTPPVVVTACSATVHVDNSWPTGFQATITVRNTGTSTVTPWTATWTMPAGATLASGWNATVTQGSDGTVTAAAPSYNPTLSPAGSVAIGFTANGALGSGPNAVKLNGATCTAG